MLANKLMGAYQPPPTPPTAGSIVFDDANAEAIRTTASLPAIGFNAFTIEAWAKRSTGDTGTIFSVSGGTSIVIASDTRFEGTLNGRAVVFSDRAVPVDTWFHLAMVKAAGVDIVLTQLYLDGVMIHQVVAGGLISSGKAAVGSDDDVSIVDGFTGKVALARFSDLVRYSFTFTPDANYGVDGDTIALFGSFDGGSTFADATGTYTLEQIGAGTATASSDGPT